MPEQPKEQSTKPRPFQDALRKALDEALTATTNVEDEIKRRFSWLIKRSGLHERNDELQRMAADLRGRLQHNREQIERRVDESIRSTLTKLRDPLVEELATLRSRAEQLGQRIEKQIRRPDKQGEDPSPDSDAAVEEGGEKQD